MQKINLSKIIERSGIPATEIAEHLFPGNMYPRVALKRVENGDGSLNEEQISKLALLVGLSIEDLFNNSTWKLDDIKDRRLCFVSGQYVAHYDKKTGLTSVFDKETLFHETVISIEGMGLSQYLGMLDQIIEEHREN